MRGRGEEGGRRGEGWEGREKGLLLAEGEGRGPSVGRMGPPLFCLCGQRLGPVNAPKCALGGQLARELTAGTCAENAACISRIII